MKKLSLSLNKDLENLGYDEIKEKFGKLQNYIGKQDKDYNA